MLNAYTLPAPYRAAVLRRSPNIFVRLVLAAYDALSAVSSQRSRLDSSREFAALAAASLDNATRAQLSIRRASRLAQ